MHICTYSHGCDRALSSTPTHRVITILYAGVEKYKLYLTRDTRIYAVKFRLTFLCIFFFLLSHAQTVFHSTISVCGDGTKIQWKWVKEATH